MPSLPMPFQARLRYGKLVLIIMVWTSGWLVGKGLHFWGALIIMLLVAAGMVGFIFRRDIEEDMIQQEVHDRYVREHDRCPEDGEEGN